MSQTVDILIDLKNAGLDLSEEELEDFSLSLADELRDGLAEEARLVRQAAAPEGSKGAEGFDWGILKAEVNLENIGKLLGWLKERFVGSTLTLEYGEVKLTYRTEQELQAQVAALERIQDLKIRVVNGKSEG